MRKSKIITGLLSIAVAAGFGLVGGLASAVVSTPIAASAASSVGGTISTAEVFSRAQYWVDQGYTYSQSNYDTDAAGRSYRDDCSGLVSEAWHLSTSYVTADFNVDNSLWHTIPWDSMQPGDAYVEHDSTRDHIELFYGWVNPSDHSKGVWKYSFNNPGDTVENPFAANNRGNDGKVVDTSTSGFHAIRYNNIQNVSGTASIYGVKSDGTLTYSRIDAATGDFLGLATSTATLGFTPKAMATLNFNTLLITGTNGHLYRVDISTNNPSLVFYTPVDLGAGWGSFDMLAFDGNKHLYGIIKSTGTLRRYDIGAAKPAAADITNYTTIDTGFGSINTLTTTGTDWLLATASDGRLLAYHVTGVGAWTGYELADHGWDSPTVLMSPGDGVIYANSGTAMYHYLDANPYDGNGSDIQYFLSDPVTTSGWSQVLLSAQPDSLS